MAGVVYGHQSLSAVRPFARRRLFMWQSSSRSTSCDTSYKKNLPCENVAVTSELSSKQRSTDWEAFKLNSCCSFFILLVSFSSISPIKQRFRWLTPSMSQPWTQRDLRLVWKVLNTGRLIMKSRCEKKERKNSAAVQKAHFKREPLLEV